MFDIHPSEFIILGIVALLVIPPKDLPKAMRAVGYWVNKLRGVARQFRSGFDTMMRETELQDMEKKWAAENERIMREHPPTSTQLSDVQMLPLAAPVQDQPAATVEMPVIAPVAETADKPAS